MHISILGYGHTNCNPDWAVETSGETFYRLYYVLDGTCHCKVANVTYQLLPGHLYLFPANVPYTISHDPGNPLMVVWQHIRMVTGSLSRKLSILEILPETPEFHVLKAVKLLSQNETLEFLPQTFDENIFNISKLIQVLLSIFGEKIDIFSSLDPRIAHAMQWISSQTGKAVTVADLAKQAKLERSHFSRLFREQTGMTAQEFLLRARLDWSATQLLNGATVTSAAMTAGYQDEKSFYRAFAKHFDTTPSQYQKNHKMQP